MPPKKKAGPVGPTALYGTQQARRFLERKEARCHAQLPDEVLRCRLTSQKSGFIHNPEKWAGRTAEAVVSGNGRTRGLGQTPPCPFFLPLLCSAPRTPPPDFLPVTMSAPNLTPITSSRKATFLNPPPSHGSHGPYVAFVLLLLGDMVVPHGPWTPQGTDDPLRLFTPLVSKKP